MKYSKQRELIENTVKENHIHPSADEVYTLLKPNNPSLSLGTVYRNLNLLAQNGNINKIPMTNGCDRFDGNLHKHYHIICDICGKIFDIELSLLNELSEKVKTQTGIEVSAHQLTINGLCQNCQKNANSL